MILLPTKVKSSPSVIFGSFTPTLTLDLTSFDGINHSIPLNYLQQDDKPVRER
jgi:hypothetical protein